MRHGTFDHQYNLYVNRYTNCTYVDGNLEITNLEGDYDLSFLKDIEEVTGYVLIVNIFSNYLNLTSLRIIRGETLYKNSSLYVALNHNPYNDSQGLLELQFTSLTGELSFLITQGFFFWSQGPKIGPFSQWNLGDFFLNIEKKGKKKIFSIHCHHTHKLFFWNASTAL